MIWVPYKIKMMLPIMVRVPNTRPAVRKSKKQQHVFTVGIFNDMNFS